MIEIPEELERRRIRSAGDAGEAWIRSLPSKVVELEDLWGFKVDGEPMHGDVGLVVPVSRQGEPLVVKVSYPDRDSVHEAVALRQWNGAGAVRLVEFDKRRNAMLLERLNSHRSLLNVPRDEAVDILAGLLRRLAVRAPAGPRTQADLVDEHTVLFDRAAGEIPRHFLDAAKEWLEAYCPSDAELIVNIDLGYGDVLAGNREPWLAIDPKVIIGRVEYGIAPLIWNLTPQELSSSLRTYFNRIIEVAELDSEQARQWTLVRMIDHWLWSWRTGLADEPVKCKHIVETLMEDGSHDNK